MAGCDTEGAEGHACPKYKDWVVTRVSFAGVTFHFCSPEAAARFLQDYTDPRIHQAPAYIMERTKARTQKRLP